MKGEIGRRCCGRTAGDGVRESLRSDKPEPLLRGGMARVEE